MLRHIFLLIFVCALTYALEDYDEISNTLEKTKIIKSFADPNEKIDENLKTDKESSILNDLNRKVDQIIEHLEQNNVTQIMEQYKSEILSEIQQLVNKANDHQCEKKSKSMSDLGRNCTIRNRRFPEYFYPADGFDYDSSRRRVFTWIPGDHDFQCLWDIERFGADSKYKIKSVKYEEYLYAAADDLKHDNDRRRVFTWKPKTSCECQCYWEIEFVGNDQSGKKYFTIKNTDFGEYFYAVDGLNYDDDRRHVFTWKFDPDHDVTNDYQSHWEIECQMKSTMI
uniref:CSON014790 protein n=1 Tax=Culicoides sonorensis TaxID=179676 RepID=A0A336M0J7_CULSO